MDVAWGCSPRVVFGVRNQHRAPPMFNQTRRELHAITLDVKMAYGIAMADPTLGALRAKRTLGLELWILRRTGATQPHRIELPSTFNKYPALRARGSGDLVSVLHCIPSGFMIELMILRRIPPHTELLWIFFLNAACFVTSWILTAADLHFLVALFAIFRHFGRVICCLPFTTTICRLSRDACNSATTTIDTAQLSPIAAGLRLGVTVLPVTYLAILT